MGKKKPERSRYARILLHAVRHRLPEVCLPSATKFKKNCQRSSIPECTNRLTIRVELNHPAPPVMAMSLSAACRSRQKDGSRRVRIISSSRRVGQSCRFTTSKGASVANLLQKLSRPVVFPSWPLVLGLSMRVYTRLSGHPPVCW